MAKKSKKDDDLKKKKKKKSSSKVEKTSKKKSSKKDKAPKAKKAAKSAKGIRPVSEKFTKSSLREYIACETGLEKRDINKVLNTLEDVILGSIKKKGLGEFTYPTLFKVVTKVKPATKERKGTNPFTGEPCIFKAKPKTMQVKVRPLVKLKKAAKGEI